MVLGILNTYVYIVYDLNIYNTLIVHVYAVLGHRPPPLSITNATNIDIMHRSLTDGH